MTHLFRASDSAKGGHRCEVFHDSRMSVQPGVPFCKHFFNWLVQSINRLSKLALMVDKSYRRALLLFGTLFDVEYAENLAKEGPLTKALSGSLQCTFPLIFSPFFQTEVSKYLAPLRLQNSNWSTVQILVFCTTYTKVDFDA